MPDAAPEHELAQRNYGFWPMLSLLFISLTVALALTIARTDDTNPVQETLYGDHALRIAVFGDSPNPKPTQTRYAYPGRGDYAEFAVYLHPGYQYVYLQVGHLTEIHCYLQFAKHWYRSNFYKYPLRREERPNNVWRYDLTNFQQQISGEYAQLFCTIPVFERYESFGSRLVGMSNFAGTGEGRDLDKLDPRYFVGVPLHFDLSVLYAREEPVAPTDVDFDETHVLRVNEQVVIRETYDYLNQQRDLFILAIAISGGLAGACLVESLKPINEYLRQARDDDFEKLF